MATEVRAHGVPRSLDDQVVVRTQRNRDRISYRVVVPLISPSKHRLCSAVRADVDEERSVAVIRLTDGVQRLAVLTNNPLYVSVWMEGNVLVHGVYVADEGRQGVSTIGILRTYANHRAVRREGKPRRVIRREAVRSGSAVDQVVLGRVGAPVNRLSELDGRVEIWVNRGEHVDVLAGCFEACTRIVVGLVATSRATSRVDNNRSP